METGDLSRDNLDPAIDTKITEFWQACTRGDLSVVKSHLLDPNLDINRQLGSRNDPALTAAVRAGHHEIVMELMAHPRIDLNVVNYGSATPFYIACQEGFLEIVRTLMLDSRVQLNLGDTDGGTPMVIAVLNGHAEVVKELLGSDKIDVNLGDQANATPLFYACYMNVVEIVGILLKSPRIDINKARLTGSTPLHVACSQGHQDTVSLLIRRPDLDVNKPVTQLGNTPLHAAASQGYFETVKILLRDERVNVNQLNGAGISPLWVAAERGQLLTVQWMIMSGRDLDLNVPPPSATWGDLTPQALQTTYREISQVIMSAMGSIEASRKLLKDTLGVRMVEESLGGGVKLTLPRILPFHATRASLIIELGLSSLNLTNLPAGIGSFLFLFLFLFYFLY
jgi:ankyrin repeat protein